MRLVLAVVLGAAGGAWAQAPAAAPGEAAVRKPTVLWTTPTKSASYGGGAVADVDGDGGLDVAFCSYFNDSKVRVLRGKDGSEIWSYEAGSGGGKGDACLDASCRFADLMGDGGLQLVVPISNTCQVIVFDAASGKKVWTYEAGRERGECIDTPPWIGDVDGDGKPEVVVGTFAARLHVINGQTGGAVKTVQIAPKGAVQSCPLVMDLNGDGFKDFIATTFKGDKRVVAASGAVEEPPLAGRPGARPVHELWHVETGSAMMYHGPSAGDLDGDGKTDFAIGAYDGKVYAFKMDGSALWTASPGERYIMGPTVMVDLDGDRTPEVVVAGDRVTALKADGSTPPLWSVPFDKPGMFWSVTRGVSVADLDGDGKPDMAALNGRGIFKVLRGSDGGTLFEMDMAKELEIDTTTSSHSPVIADLNGDGKLDVFFVVGRGESKDMSKNRGIAVCLSGFEGRAKNADGSPAGWFMFRHDPGNTGNAETALPEAVVKRLAPPK